jgi:hypothetical protein
MSTVRIVRGVYRNKPITNATFTLVKDLQTSSKGNFVTVANGDYFPGFPDEIRVKINSIDDIEFVDGGPMGKADKVVEFKACEIITPIACLNDFSLAASKYFPTHSNVFLKFKSKPTPITKGLKVIPLDCNASETAQGSPLHSSTPSVIKIIIFLQLAQAGKSAPHCSKV